MKTRKLFYVIASALLAILVLGCPATTAPDKPIEVSAQTLAVLADIKVSISVNPLTTTSSEQSVVAETVTEFFRKQNAYPDSAHTIVGSNIMGSFTNWTGTITVTSKTVPADTATEEDVPFKVNVLTASGYLDFIANLFAQGPFQVGQTHQF